MALFEIDLNQDFKFNEKSPYLSKDEFNIFFKKNNPNQSYGDSEYIDLIDSDYMFVVHQDSVLNRRLTYHENACDNAKKIISINLFETYQQHFNGTSVSEVSSMLFGDNQNYTLYPNWQLFYIGLDLLSFSNYYKLEFEKHIETFKNISEILYKNYIIRNIGIDARFNDDEERMICQKNLQDKLSSYIEITFENSDELLEFLKYLLTLHYVYKEHEKYKFMWNLESSYIISTIYILIREFNMGYTEIVEHLNLNRMGNRRSNLNDVYIDPFSYVKENKFYYSNDGYVRLINTIFNCTVEENDIVTVLNNDERYIEVLKSIIELNKRFYSNKRCESTAGSIIRGIVLNIEEMIREKVPNNDRLGLLDCLQKVKPCSHLLRPLRDKMPAEINGEIYFNNIKEIIKNEEETIEKYLMIYYHSRNYIAHNIIDFDRLFYEEDKIVINNILNTIIIILYFLKEEVE